MDPRVARTTCAAANRGTVVVTSDHFSPQAPRSPRGHTEVPELGRHFFDRRRLPLYPASRPLLCSGSDELQFRHCACSRSVGRSARGSRSAPGRLRSTARSAAADTREPWPSGWTHGSGDRLDRDPVPLAAAEQNLAVRPWPLRRRTTATWARCWPNWAERGRHFARPGPVGR